MKRYTKLMVLSVLAGTLGLVGCGSDSTDGDGGSGGTAGTGGAPMLSACSDGPLADTGQTGTGALACDAGLPFNLSLRFNATPANALQAGPNDFLLQLEIAIDADTVNNVVDFAQMVDVTAVRGTINATAGDSAGASFELVDDGVPCSTALVRDEASVIVTSMQESSWTLDEGNTLELTLEASTLAVVALGLPVRLTTEGAEPSCTFIGDPPSVQFTLP